MTPQQVAVVVGVGPGLGAAVARRFAREGFAVGLMARGMDKLEPVDAEIRADGGMSLSVPADATDPASMGAAFETVRERWGPPSVLVYNAGAFHMGSLCDITPRQFEDSWKSNCMGGFLAAQQVVPPMVARGSGTIIFTGATASLRGSAHFACLAVGKFGLRALAQSLAREYGPRGVHVAHVIIDGVIEGPRIRGAARGEPDRTLLDPDAIAETYWQLHRQDPSAWTLELDLRPATEKF